MINDFRGISDQIVGSTKKIRRPIEQNIESLKINRLVFNDIWGCKKAIYDGEISNIVISDKVINEERSIVNKKMILTIKTPVEEVKYELGYYGFIENMVCLMEAHIFGEQSLPLFPYHSIEKVLLYYKKAFSKTEVVKICEIALLFHDPIMAFLGFLDKYKGDNSDEGLINAFYKDVGFNGPDENETSIDKYIEKTFVESKREISGWFERDFCMDINVWVNKLYAWGQEKRKDKLFLSKIICNEREKAKSIVFETIKETGIPLILNNKMQCFSIFHESIVNTTVLLGLSELYDYLFDSKNDCGLYDYCKGHLSEVGDSFCENCLKSPCENVNKEPLCMFALWCKSLGFGNKIV